jgi:hypothetical protein
MCQTHSAFCDFRKHNEWGKWRCGIVVQTQQRWTINSTASFIILVA